MSEIDWNKVAAACLGKCASKDPFFPKPSAALAMGWGEEFQKWNIEPQDLIDGVSKAYSDNGAGFRPLPKDIVDAARAIRRDRDARTGPTDHYQDLCDAKAGDAEALARIRARTGQTFGRAIGEPV